MLQENQKNFNREAKTSLKKEGDFRCAQCQKKFPSKELEIHHNYVWISEAKRYGIPGNFVANQKNGIPLCEKCHDELHRQQRERSLGIVVQGLIALSKETHQGHQASKLIGRLTRPRRG